MRLNFTWKSKESNLRQPKLSAFYRKRSSNFSISECYFFTYKIIGPHPFEIFFKKRWGWRDQNGGVGKIGEAVLKKEKDITYFNISMKISDSWLTNLFLSVWCCVCVCVLFTCTIFISIICVSQNEPSLTTSNQQMNNLQVNIFEKKRHSGK